MPSKRQPLTAIYALCDPDGAIRYIGKTIFKPQTRLTRHIIKARNSLRKSEKSRWILSLIERGQPPIIKVIQLCEGDGCDEETGAIKTARLAGIKLFNLTDGGEGATGYRFDDRHRKGISERNKRLFSNPIWKALQIKKMHENHPHLGIPHTNKTKAKMSVAQRSSDKCRAHLRRIQPMAAAAARIKLKGRKKTAEHCEHIRETLRRKHGSAEQRLKFCNRLSLVPVSRAEISRICGISPGHASWIVLGRTLPSLSLISRIESALAEKGIAIPL